MIDWSSFAIGFAAAYVLSFVVLAAFVRRALIEDEQW